MKKSIIIIIILTLVYSISFAETYIDTKVKITPKEEDQLQENEESAISQDTEKEDDAKQLESMQEELDRLRDETWSEKINR